MTEVRISINKRIAHIGRITYTINDQQLSTHVLTCIAGEEDDWPCKVGGLAPSASRDTFRYLTKTCWVLEELFIPVSVQGLFSVGSWMEVVKGEAVQVRINDEAQ